MLRRLFYVALTFTTLLLAAAAFGNVAERWLIYPLDASHVAPKNVGLPELTEKRLNTLDAETLVVWLAKPKPGQPVILYFHGNAGNLAARAGRFRHFLDRGYGLIAPAYRGSSGSSGAPSEAALKGDAILLYSMLSHLLPQTTPQNLVIYGESLGSAVTIHLMASTMVDPVKGIGPPAAVILEAPFTSIPALAEAHYPSLAALAKQFDNRWDNLRWIENLHAPLLILHGMDDALIPIDMGRQLLAAAPSKAKRIVAAPGAGHTDLWRSDTLPQIWRFIDAYLVR